MDQEETQVVEGASDVLSTAATEEKRGPILATIQVRVTIRDDVDGDGESTYIPTNDAIEELVEAAFRAGGYPNVNARAEKV